LLGLLGMSLILVGSIPRTTVQAQGAEQADSSTVRKVTVNGNGEVSASPDMGVIQLGVTTQAEMAADSLTENNTEVQAVIDALKAAGVKEADIQTQTFSMSPTYDNSSTSTGQQKINGYQVTNTVQVTVRDLEKMGEILDASVQAGANTIDNIQFEISDSSQLLDQAREAAMADAQNKAEQLASLSDASLGMVLEIQEYSSTPAVSMRSTAMEAAAVPIQAGSQTVSVQVTVTWELQ